MHVPVIGAYGSAGLCILDGCVPSKEVLSATAHRFQARHDDRIVGTPEVDLESAVAAKFVGSVDPARRPAPAGY